MLGGLGMSELLVIGAIALLIFGPRQLPKMGKALGETIKEFRGVGKQLADIHDEVDNSAREMRDTVNRATRG